MKLNVRASVQAISSRAHVKKSLTRACMIEVHEVRYMQNPASLSVPPRHCDIMEMDIKGDMSILLSRGCTRIY